MCPATCACDQIVVEAEDVTTAVLNQNQADPKLQIELSVTKITKFLDINFYRFFRFHWLVVINFIDCY